MKKKNLIYLSFSIAAEYVITAAIEGWDDIRLVWVVQRKLKIAPILVDQQRWVFEKTNQKLSIVSRVELDFEERRRESIFPQAIAGDHMPNAYCIICGCAKQLKAIPVPAQWAYGVHMSS